MSALTSLSRWLHPFTDRDALNRLLAGLRPTWSLGRIRARIVDRVQEDADTVSLWLRPNRAWRGHRAGQHVLLEVEIDGRQQRRAFSLACAPRRGEPLRITVRRSPRAQVSDCAVSRLKIGDLVGLSQASGEFVLPQPLPEKLLLLGAGSGMTPMIAMLQALTDAGHGGDVVLLQVARDHQRLLFVDELRDLRASLPGLRVIEHLSATAGRLDGASLHTQVTDLDARHLMICGPQALMDAVQRYCNEQRLATRVQRESYGPPLVSATDAATTGEHRAFRSDSEQSFTLSPQHSLLEAAEAAGLNPPNGCRAGICRTCLCEKRSGRTRNLLTGASSDQPGEWIQLCIHRAESDLELVL